MKSKKYITYGLILLVVIVSCIIGYNSLYPSKANYDDYTKVNTANQINHIKEIAKEPHSIYDREAHDEVRDYLLSELKKLDIDSKLYTYEDVYIERSKSKEKLENIYAEIKGKSDSYIMLVTHYDSSRAKTERYAEKDGSKGAADAGYGLSTILETLRVIKENNVTLNNGIKILITDGEECGLAGAKEAVKEKEIFENVNYLINLEARGTKGPAIMFETSPNNSSVVDLYNYSEKPFSYSITPEIYRLLPNGTDFTVFLENNIPGINISVLDGLENYHTPNDSIESVNDRSLQHYGDQVLPIVTEFVSNEKYTDKASIISNNDAIFFSIGSAFIKYSKTINYTLIGIILLAIIFLFNKLKIKNILVPIKYSLVNLGFTTLVAIVCYGISRLAAIVNNRPFKLTYLPLIKHEKLAILAIIAVALITYILLIKKISKRFKEKNEYILGSIILLFLLGLILTFVLPGGSYLFIFPAIIISLSTILCTILNGKINKISYILLIPASLIIVLYIPTVYLFNAALTFGALCVTMIFAIIGIISVTTCLIQVD